VPIKFYYVRNVFLPVGACGKQCSRCKMTAITPTALTRPGEMGPMGIRKNSTAAEGKD
jgi:hypothetical protein